MPYCRLAGARIRFGYCDPSVRPSSCLTRSARSGVPAAGSFASNSSRTFSTICFQRRSFASCSRETRARRASSALRAFFQDACYIIYQWSELIVTRGHAPRATGHGECIPPYAGPGLVHSTVPGWNCKSRLLEHEEPFRPRRLPRIKRQDERNS